MSDDKHANAARQKLVEAMRSGHADRVRACLARGVDPNASFDGLRMLGHAIRQPPAVRDRMVELLIKAGADPHDWLQFCAAAAMGDARVVGHLLDAGAEID